MIPFASLMQACGAVGGSRYVGGVCGCSDMEGGAQRNLKARFDFLRLRGKRRKEKNPGEQQQCKSSKITANPVWREV